jgi:hypothetical protein
VTAPRAVALAAALLLSVFSFVSLARAHGRQVRLQRERAGYHHVVFGGQNPAFVEAVWRRDRWRFWPTFGVVALATGLWLARARARGGRRPLGGGRLGTAWGLIYLPFAAAFTVAGVSAVIHFHAGGAADPAFTAASVPGSVRLWATGLVSLVLTLGVVMAVPPGAPAQRAPT